MGRFEYRNGLAHIIAEPDAFGCRCIRPIFNTEVKSDKLPDRSRVRIRRTHASRRPRLRYGAERTI